MKGQLISIKSVFWCSRCKIHRSVAAPFLGRNPCPFSNLFLFLQARHVLYSICYLAGQAFHSNPPSPSSSSHSITNALAVGGPIPPVKKNKKKYCIRVFSFRIDTSYPLKESYRVTNIVQMLFKGYLILPIWLNVHVYQRDDLTEPNLTEN